MRSTASLVLMVGLLLAPAARGQDVKPASQGTADVHRMEIMIGATRTVQYFSSSTSSGEAQSWRALARVENEAAYADELQSLRREYVASERRLEPARQAAQLASYNVAVDAAYAPAFQSGTYLTPQYNYNYSYPFAYSYSYPFSNSYYGARNYGGGVGLGAAPLGLAYAAGRESPLKEEMSKLVARQATPEYVASVDRQLGQALASLPGDKKTGEGRFVDFERSGPPRNVTVLLKGGDKIDGGLISQDLDWVVVRTASGEERVRMSEVVRVTTKNMGK